MRKERIYQRGIIIMILLITGLTACKKNDDNDDLKDFDRKAMLENMGKEIIVPAYDEAYAKAKALQAAMNEFLANQNASNLTNLSNQFNLAYEGWQEINLFEFGPAMDHSLKSNLNIFPPDSGRIEQNVQTGDFQLDILQNKAAKGFPAVDYLLFSRDAENTLISFTSGPNAENRRNYLAALINDIEARIGQVQQAWNPGGGNYLQQFINNSGTDVGSSTGMLINAFNQHYERNFLDAKIGIPTGVRSAGIPRPKETESYYEGMSVKLALKNLEVIENFYLGKNKAGINGQGLDDHLIAADAASLDNSIQQQLQVAKTRLSGLNDPLSATIVSNNSEVLAAYQELKKLVVLFKSEMPSRLGVLITYQDNDGD